MYTRCPACRGDLGRNEALPAFPVGRRLAYDPDRGRLWAVCHRFRAWNLAPLLERWEALEEAEAASARGVVGSSTEHVALVRLPDGTELVRVGEKVGREEFAGWRFQGRVRGRLRRFAGRHAGWGAAGAAAAVGTAVAWPAAPLLAVGALAVGPVGALVHERLRPSVMGSVGPIEVGDRTLGPDTLHWSELRRDPASTAGWCVRVPVEEWGPGWGVPPVEAPRMTLRDADGLRVLRTVLPGIGFLGYARSVIANASSEVVRLGSAGAVLRAAADELDADDAWQPVGRAPGRGFRGVRAAGPRHLVVGANPVIRLALEMVANEETERRAIEGEMDLIEREWAEAEALAAISDDLLLPDSVRERIAALRARPDEETGRTG